MFTETTNSSELECSLQSARSGGHPDCIVALTQEQALAKARQQFEREQTAAKQALRSFAPGFGAGKLLADAMSRRTTKVQCHVHFFSVIDVRRIAQASYTLLNNLQMPVSIVRLI